MEVALDAAMEGGVALKGAGMATVLVVDDDPLMGDLLVRMLKHEYRVVVAREGLSALRAAREGGVDLILLDLVMPVMNGFEVCRLLKDDPRTRDIPVVLLSVDNHVEAEAQGFGLGAVEYITKPFNPRVVRTRIRAQLALANQERHLELLVQKRTRKLEEAGLEMIRQLGRVSELRDGVRDARVSRVSGFAYLIALKAGLTERQAGLLRAVAPLHDLGKVGVPDHILLKPGPLAPDEWEILRTHCEVGYRIIGEHDGELLRTAALCAYCHHERWDGGGYPRRLRGEAIPLEARILAVADVFDALTRDRPYRRAWPVDAAVAELMECAGSQFDPLVVDAFLSALPQIKTVMRKYPGGATPPLHG